MAEDPIKVILRQVRGLQAVRQGVPVRRHHDGGEEGRHRPGQVHALRRLREGLQVRGHRDAREGAPAAGRDLSAYKDVWVFAEQADGEIQSVTYELLGEGRKLADALGMKLCAVLLGSGVTPHGPGADRSGARTRSTWWTGPSWPISRTSRMRRS